MKKKYIVFCGYNVFPHGFAQTQRILLIAKGLTENNCNTTILCTYGIYDKTQTQVKYKGQIDGINYIHCSGLAFRPNSFIIRNLRKIWGGVVEIYLLLKFRIYGELDYLFISTNSFKKSLYYSILSKFLFVHSVIDNTEFWSAPTRMKRFSLDAKLHDYLSPMLYSKVICISDYLYNYTLKTRTHPHILKIPALVDFSLFHLSTDTTQINERSILFCGSAAYYPIIDFIISAFELANVNGVRLILVASNGVGSDYDKLNSRIKNSTKTNSIEIRSNLKYSELIQLYKDSNALLIPLRPNIQDMARFPHKLGEYTASKSIIITTKFGEIPNYFQDMKNALVANDFETNQFAEKIEFSINNYHNLNILREASYQTGVKYFDYKLNGTRIYNFLFPSSHKQDNQ
jgi:glycosyltransferase involved in cell wall biosynthesis